jgi:Zn-dependent oligopeptidase
MPCTPAAASSGLDGEQRRVLERFHLDFVRAGAKLAPAEQARYAAVMQRLAELTTRFGQNVLADESEFLLVLESEGRPRRAAEVRARRGPRSRRASAAAPAPR